MKRIFPSLLFLVPLACAPRPAPVDPDSPAGILARLKEAKSPSAIATLAQTAAEKSRFNANSGAFDAELVAGLDPKRFEDAWFLENFALRLEGPGKLDAAVAKIRWPDVPAGWSEAERAEVFRECIRNPQLRSSAPVLADARAALAQKLWKTASQAAPVKERLERALRTPMRASLLAMTEKFDTRLRIVADGTDGIAASDGGKDLMGNPVELLAYTKVREQVAEAMRSLVDVAFDRLGLGFEIAVSDEEAEAPATLEFHYTLERGEQVYEMMGRHTSAVTLKGRVTLHAGTNVWSREVVYQPDMPIEYDAAKYGLSAGVLDNVLGKMKTELLQALLAEQ